MKKKKRKDKSRQGRNELAKAMENAGMKGVKFAIEDDVLETNFTRTIYDYLEKQLDKISEFLDQD